MASTWKEFWNKENKIYVSPQHLKAHYEALGENVLELLPSYRPLRLLDWGCGEALAAPLITDSGVDVLLYDPIPLIQERIFNRFKDVSGINVLDEIENIQSGSVDVILIHSVLQYIPKGEFERLLFDLRKLLKPRGILLLGDIVPTSLKMTSDVTELLQSGLKNDFFFAALKSLVVTFFSDYRAVRQKNGFTTYTEEEVCLLLKKYGFIAERLKKNIGLSSHRMLIRGVL